MAEGLCKRIRGVLKARVPILWYFSADSVGNICTLVTLHIKVGPNEKSAPQFGGCSLLHVDPDRRNLRRRRLSGCLK